MTCAWVDWSTFDQSTQPMPREGSAASWVAVGCAVGAGAAFAASSAAWASARVWRSCASVAVVPPLAVLRAAVSAATASA